MKSRKKLWFSILAFIFIGGGTVWINLDSVNAMSKGYILKWTAIRVASDDFQRSNNFSMYEAKAKLKGDEWVVIFILKKPSFGGGANYHIDARTGRIIKSLFFQ